YTLTITPTDVPITCCNTSTLQFTVTDEYSNVVGAVVSRPLTVSFTSTPYGIFTPTNIVVITDGVGSVEFHGYESGSGAITGTVNGVIGTATLTVAPASCNTLDITAGRPWIYVTDTNTSLLTDFPYTTTITAELSDSCNNPVQNGTAVTFDTSLGDLSPANPITTVNGLAVAVLTSEQLSGAPTGTAYITVTGTACPVTDTTSVGFRRHVYTLTVTADPDQREVGGETSDLTADVDDGFGGPTPGGVMVGFTITPSIRASVPYEYVEAEDGSEVTAPGWSVAATHIQTDTVDAWAAWNFTGTAVSFVYHQQPAAGSVNVTVNNPSYARLIDMSGPDAWVERVITTGLSLASRNVTVTVQSGSVEIDAFRSGATIGGGAGRATAIATPGTEAGVATIEAAAIGSIVTDTAPITITAGDPYTLTITPTDVPITCCNTSTLQFTVTDEYSNVVGAVVSRPLTVSFTSTPYGIFTPTNIVVITDGVGSVEFHGYEAGSGAITGTVSGITGTATLTVAAAPCNTLNISAVRSWIYVTDTNTYLLTDFPYTTTITAELRDSCNNPVQNGTAVTFHTGLGNVDPASTTTFNGLATAVLTSGQLSPGEPTRIVNVSATGAGCPAPDFTTVKFVRHVYTLTVTANPDEMRVGGNLSTLTADVKDGFGNPSPNGVEVGFTISPTAMASVPAGPVETTGGAATAIATSGTEAGVATIEAAAIGSTVTNTAPITITAGTPFTLTITPTDIDTTCCATNTMHFTVTDQYSNVVGATVSRPVTVCLDCDPDNLVDSWSPGSCVSTTNGVGSVEFHSYGKGTGTIEGYAQGFSPDAKDTSNINVAADSPATLNVTREPDSILADGFDSTTITATVKDSCENPVVSTIVTFTTDLGSFEPPPTTTLSITATTDASGVATATLRSVCVSNRVNITVTVDSLAETTHVNMVGVAWDMQLAADPTSIPVGGHTSNLTATVEDQFGNSVLDGTVVTFTSSLGNLGSDTVAKTTTSGVATAVLTSSNATGTAFITATAGIAVDAVTVTFEPGPPYTVTLEAYPMVITVGNTSALTVTVTDQYGNPVADGTEVIFATDLGDVGSQLALKHTTGGVATAQLTSEVDGTATVTATADSKYDTVPVTFLPDLPDTLTLAADPTTLTVGASSTLTATVTDQYDNDVADGTMVHFETNLGSLGSTAIDKPTANGIATATLTSLLPGTAAITATADPASDTAGVTFEAGPPYTVTLEAYPISIPVAGATSALTATVVDLYNNPVADGTPVTFTTSLGSVGSAEVVKTTSGGIALATLTSETTVGTAFITATADSRFDTATVEFTPLLPYTVTLAAYPLDLTVGETSALTATVVDQYANNVADGTSVLFETNLGSLGSLSVTKTTTDGIALATLTSQVPGTATVAATADSVSDTEDVTFEPGPPYTVTLEANPASILVGGFTSALTVTVVDQFGNNVADETGVHFEASLGSLGGNGTVDKATLSGVATATLTSGDVTGVAMITATAGSEVATTVVTLTPDIPDVITLIADPTSLTVGETSALTSTVKDQYDNNVADGTIVTFTTNLGDVGSQLVLKPTTSGVATAELTSQLPGVATVNAMADSKVATTTVEFQPGPPYTVTLVALPTSLPVGETSSLTATVKDQYNNDVADGTVVSFETDLGSVGSTTIDKTTVNGVVTATLTSQVSGIAVVTATSGSEYDTANVTFNPGPPDTMTVEADPTSIPIGGFTSDVTATVRDQYSNLVADGTEVTFATDLGSIGSSSTVTTTVNGVANATLTSELVIGTADITVTSGSAEGQTQVIFTVGAPQTVVVESWPPTIEVGGNTATITATVRDIGGYPVADGTPVVFTTDFASLGSSTVTKYTTDGVAVATLTSGTTPGVAHITAESNSKSGTAIVKVAAGPPFDIQVTADPAYIPIGETTSRIMATVKDRYGNNVINGTTVDFITTLGTLWPSSDTTIEGAAVVTLTSGLVKGPATVTAISGPGTGSVDVIFTVGPPFFVSVEADPTTIGLNGQTSNIQATVRDIGGNDVADGTEVTFSTSLGVLGSDTVIKTTTNGVATAMLTSETIAGTATITATADSHSHTTQVVINPGPPDDVAVTANPMLIPADGVSTAAIRALVTDQYGNPVADGTNCSFETTLGSIWPLFDATLNGVAETTLTAGEDTGLAVVKANCAGLEDTILVSFYVPRFKLYLPLVFKRY
nr:Ig-like domain-containing protein [Anaerolineales bacterium]